MITPVPTRPSPIVRTSRGARQREHHERDDVGHEVQRPEHVDEALRSRAARGELALARRSACTSRPRDVELRRNARPPEERGCDEPARRPKRLPLPPARCASPSSPTSTLTRHALDAVLEEIDARRSTRSGASATSSATGRAPNRCCELVSRARRRLPGRQPRSRRARDSSTSRTSTTTRRRPRSGRAARSSRRVARVPVGRSSRARKPTARALPRERARPGLGVRAQRPTPRTSACCSTTRAARARRAQPRRARDRSRRRPSCTAASRRRARRSSSTGRWLLNPGSVGQPRDGDPRAAWLAARHSSAQRARFHRVAYRSSERRPRCASAGCPRRSPSGSRTASRKRG